MFTLKELQKAIRYEGGFSRRLFLSYGATLASIPMMGRTQSANEKQTFSANPISLGVASGEPTSSSVVLWTRLAPKPLEPDGGMRPVAVEVMWEIAEDESMKKVVRRGTAIATHHLGHTIHVQPESLKPDRWYWFRFRAGDAESPIGRTRTFPESAVLPEKVKFAFASCQHFEHGLFTAYEQMAKDDLDLIFHLGDYIYEYEGKDNKVRKHIGKETGSLSDYRVRHAQYRSDPLLATAHARCPWLVTWDDHEFDNNCAGDISEEKGIDPAEFLLRRANAYQAYYEAMPLGLDSLPQGPDMKIYRQASFGRLAQFFVLDTRQYRTDQPNEDKPSELNEAALSPKNTMLGHKQRKWLQGALIGSQGHWNVLAQQVMMEMAAIDRKGLAPKYSMDQWPGYAHERMALMRYIEDRKISNPVVLTGDIHSNWANDLRVDDRKPESPVVATEFVGSSISSGGNGQIRPNYLPALHAVNPGVKFHNTERGYVRCEVTKDLWKSDYVAVEDVLKPGGNIVTRATFVVESGKPGAQKS